MTTVKNKALTRQTFVSKVTSLPFNMLPMFVMHECIGEGNGNPLQYSCLEKTRDRGAWWAGLWGCTESDMTGVT